MSKLPAMVVFLLRSACVFEWLVLRLCMILVSTMTCKLWGSSFRSCTPVSKLFRSIQTMMELFVLSTLLAFGVSRRDLLLLPTTLAPNGAWLSKTAIGGYTLLSDPNTYDALVKWPESRPTALLLSLHGAGRNQDPIEDALLRTDHAGTLPFADSTTLCVVAPYARDCRSFYEEPRQKLLDFWRFASKELSIAQTYLYGFSDGATVAVELATTGLFSGVALTGYGFTGTLPSLAVERLSTTPFWVFHSQQDEIFRVTNARKLVKSLRSAGNDRVRLTEYENLSHFASGQQTVQQNELYLWYESLGSL